MNHSTEERVELLVEVVKHHQEAMEGFQLWAKEMIDIVEELEAKVKDQQYQIVSLAYTINNPVHRSD